MPTVCMYPLPTGPDQGDGGVRRVVDALVQHLPAFGWQVTNDPNGADLIANHGAFAETRPGIPMVSHCHGLYWDDYNWPSWGDRVNGQVVASLLAADAVTAPSEWVANAIRRGSLLAPVVIYHGVDLGEPGSSRGYVLWNKARVDPVSDPVAVEKLARLLPAFPFVTTHGGAGLPNVQQIGTTDYAQMREIVRHAGVYLATVRETFGIGTLEAMAAGVPVVGWDFAGQREIVTPETGILVPEGDYDMLAKAVQWALQDREAYGKGARADVATRWLWPDKVKQYAELYDKTLGASRAPRPRVSVVITTHNLNRFLLEAYGSAQQADEVIVVDDCGTEKAEAVLPSEAGVVRPPHNLGLSGARNYGASLATGKYLIFLDADDMLAPGALDRLASALDCDPAIHVAYGGLDLVDERGSNRRPNPWPGASVDFRAQAAHLNQLHYAGMWRRDAFVRSGGFRSRDWRAEDAAHWLRIMGQGIRIARVTDEATLLYRVRVDSKSQEEARTFPDRDGDWTYWSRWRAGAKSGPEGSDLKRDGGIRLNPSRVPFSAPQPPIGKHAWPVKHHAKPLVSIVIPVGPGHAPYLVDALDSVLAQTVDAWECIVVDDTGQEGIDEKYLVGHAWVRLFETRTHPTEKAPSFGAGAARNVGIQAARAPLVLFLDADDMLTPNALELLLSEYTQGDAPFVYGDAALWTGRWDDAVEILRAPEFDQKAWLAQAGGTLALPAVTMLIETEAARTVGFDEALPGWEDGLFYLELAAAGYCGRRAPGVTLHYRTTTGARRKLSQKQAKQLTTTIGARITMAKGCGCGGSPAASTLARDALNNLTASPETLAESVAPAPDGTVRMKYTGPMAGTFTFRAQPTGTAYQAGNNTMARYLNVKPDDVPFVLGQEGFEVVGR